MTDTRATHTYGAEAGESPRTRARYDPPALDDEPAVAALLASLGLGAFDPDGVTSHVGRNDNWSGPTTTGARVFVKRLGGPSPADARRRFSRLLAFESLAARAAGGALRGPRFLGHDERELLVAFELLDDARSGAELAADDAFDDELCRAAGRITGALHELPADAGSLDATPHPLPATDKLRALPLPAFTGATFGELETWRLLQADGELMEALARLRRREQASADKRPIHGDLRLDQFLWTPERLHLTDWEEFRLGDPARDVGAFVGEWLYFAVRGIPKAIGNEPGFTFGHETTHDEILAFGVRELDRLRPRTAAFWDGYRSVRTTVDEGLRARAAAFAGWHMFDRMFATAMVGGRVQAADRACAGIGRTVLLSPDGFTDLLGLTGHPAAHAAATPGTGETQ
ncbi:class V lanthionine synthetase subunit LxmK [Streptomyces sediminimaris]|uniref:class V lanthionine synthetase subunit LxmK n=1 Tax=Streptomyces sediminimaris TaxID=3383721 RepID=UPI003999A9DA